VAISSTQAEQRVTYVNAMSSTQLLPKVTYEEHVTLDSGASDHMHSRRKDLADIVAFITDVILPDCADINIDFPDREGSLRLDYTDCEFSRQCVEDAMYANEHNQTSGQRWLERRRKRRRWRYNGVRQRCTVTTEERRSVKAEDLIDSFPTRSRLQGSR